MDVFKKFCDAGFNTMFLPEEYGGQGFGAFDMVLVNEEFAKIDAGFICSATTGEFGIEPVLLAGTEEQKRYYMDYILRGKLAPLPLRSRMPAPTRAIRARLRCATGTNTSSTAANASLPAAAWPTYTPFSSLWTAARHQGHHLLHHRKGPPRRLRGQGRGQDGHGTVQHRRPGIRGCAHPR
jgi:hypothetical protein